jgi:mycothiol synthase
MTAVRPVETDADLEAWLAVRNVVVSNEPATVEQIRREAEPERLLLLAEEDGVATGCAIVRLSNFGGKAFVAVRVLPGCRRRGIGTALYDACAAHARSLGRDGVNAFVYADEPHSKAFAERLGLQDVDYQLEQVRVVADERAPEAPAGVELRALGGDRAELLQRAWTEVAEAVYPELPLPGEVHFKEEVFLRDEATRPDGSFVALEGGTVVGYAGLIEHARGPAVAEHGLTAVRRDRRRSGIGRALKQSQLRWAAENGVVELVTWTQRGNEAMQALNRSLGYVDKAKVITYQGPLPELRVLYGVETPTLPG